MAHHFLHTTSPTHALYNSHMCVLSSSSCEHGLTFRPPEDCRDAWLVADNDEAVAQDASFGRLVRHDLFSSQLPQIPPRIAGTTDRRLSLDVVGEPWNGHCLGPLGECLRCRMKRFFRVEILTDRMEPKKNAQNSPLTDTSWRTQQTRHAAQQTNRGHLRMAATTQTMPSQRLPQGGLDTFVG